MPLLNRIQFQKYLDAGLHLRNEGFGSVVLLVCAIGARFSDDKRVLLEGSESWHTSGWKWFQHVQTGRQMLDLSPPTLFDVQVPSVSVPTLDQWTLLRGVQLAAVYLYGSPTPHAASVLTAYGLRLAMDLGAHKRRVYKQFPNTEDELLKRAFWYIYLSALFQVRR